MAHPQSSPRGFEAHKRLDVGSSQLTYNSTGLVLNNALYLSGGSVKLTANSTGVISSGAVYPSAAVGGSLTANSTAVIASALSIGSLASYITADSTGILIGALYISCNSTGNTTT